LCRWQEAGEQCLSCAPDCGHCDGGDGCSATPGKKGCDGCICLQCVCNLMPECCAVEWTDDCVAACTQSCGQTCP